MNQANGGELPQDLCSIQKMTTMMMTNPLLLKKRSKRSEKDLGLLKRNHNNRPNPQGNLKKKRKTSLSQEF
jgi:hypothetical protein